LSHHSFGVEEGKREEPEVESEWFFTLDNLSLSINLRVVSDQRLANKRLEIDYLFDVKFIIYYPTVVSS
jgi:hypothetical protein